MARKDKTLERFGQQLADLRLAAGFLSLDAAIEASKRKALKGFRPLSKSLLSLYERGRIKSPNPDILRTLAALYDSSFEDLARQCFEERYGAAGPASYKAEQILQGPAGAPEAQLYSLEKFSRIQAGVPKSSEVGVCAVNFVDDQLYFDLLLHNLERGIRYSFVLPAAERTSYEACLQKIAARCPRLKGRLDGRLARFYCRPSLDFPVSYVLHFLPNGAAQGFISLPVGDRPYYYQAADAKLSLRLLQSFRWTLTVASDEELMRRLAVLQFETERQRGAAARTLVP